MSRAKRNISPQKTIAAKPPAETPSRRAPDDDYESPLVKISEAARALQVTERTIQTYLASGLLERIKISAQTTRISRASLMKLMGQPAE